MGLIAILQLALYSEFNTVALIYGVAIHATDMDNFMIEGHTVQYFVVYFIHFWIISFVLRSFMNMCFNKQAGVTGADLATSNDPEETAV